MPGEAEASATSSPPAANLNTSFLARANSSLKASLSRSPPQRTEEAQRSDVRRIDTETKRMAGVVAALPGDYMTFVANDPSVAHHRISQNIHRVVPQLVGRTAKMEGFTEDVGFVHEELRDSIKSMEGVCDIPVFKSLHSKLFCAIDLAQALADHLEPAAPTANPPPRQAPAS